MALTFATTPAAQRPGYTLKKIRRVMVTGIRAHPGGHSIETKRPADRWWWMLITAEDVGKFPDKNVAEALQRIPGVATQPRVRRR